MIVVNYQSESDTLYIHIVIVIFLSWDAFPKNQGSLTHRKQSRTLWIERRQYMTKSNSIYITLTNSH